MTGMEGWGKGDFQSRFAGHLARPSIGAGGLKAGVNQHITIRRSCAKGKAGGKSGFFNSDL
jgi:hypothetical protein